jgi:hypothetical protein
MESNKLRIALTLNVKRGGTRLNQSRIRGGVQIVFDILLGFFGPKLKKCKYSQIWLVWGILRSV